MKAVPHLLPKPLIPQCLPASAYRHCAGRLPHQGSCRNSGTSFWLKRSITTLQDARATGSGGQHGRRLGRRCILLHAHTHNAAPAPLKVCCHKQAHAVQGTKEQRHPPLPAERKRMCITRTHARLLAQHCGSTGLVGPGCAVPSTGQAYAHARDTEDLGSMVTD